MDLSAFTPGTALVTVVLIALAPFFAVMVTSFTKIVVVLSLVRNALGLQQVPPNLVLNGLALILSLYVMYPTIQQMQVAAGPNVAASAQQADQIFSTADRAKEPLRAFLIEHSDPGEREFFVRTQARVAAKTNTQAAAPTDFIVVIPAFIVKELTTAFQIGFLLFLPFLVIDLVISNILLALGMMMLSPVTISLPFKLLLFVLVDGWVKISHNLVLSYV
ncbi:type III secretion system export apparatus subunit SctR [Sphingomonas sp. Y38-1Y]|uniref:type III secretion system export apparatus subunit SctR n=1 Tax=Sphingomonas sp. Y38-1Y TaxID=3078265 RepID=UPI0028EA737F|nr:type III secretion system export apparatus subunit SctR [Sphingomonas sp. Y38-1Y]